MPAPSPGQGRAVLVLNAAVAVVLLVVVAAVALVVRPPAPPGIAEFAPQAAKPISRAPAQQAGQFGGAGSCAPGLPCTGTGAAPHRGRAAPKPLPVPPAAGGAAGVPSALQCFVWPDGSVTQTFDPQSPPCVSNWPDAAAGNGGATSPGVSATTIRVAAGEPETGSPTSDYLSLATFFNTSFELYGRRLQVVFPPETGGFDYSPAGQQADAASFASVHPFAATDLPILDAQDPRTFVDSLARRHVVTTAETPGSLTTGDLAAAAPYAWTYASSLDRTERNLAELLCRSLPASGTARYGGAAGSGTRRKLAILLPDSQSNSGLPAPPTSDLARGLASCGAAAPTFTYTFAERDASAQAADSQLMLSLRNGGYTSLVFFGHVQNATDGLMAGADSIGYEPEWISTGIGDQGSSAADSEWAAGPADQITHLFGIAPWSKYLPVAQQPWAQAYSQENSSAAVANDAAGLATFYHQLLIIASGIQTAGPRLTPASFAAGLQAAAFPNPGAARSPAYQAQVGFGSGDHQLQRDFAAWWYSPSTTSQDSFPQRTPGATCDVEKGARWSLGGWPAAPLPFFAAGAPCY